METASPRSSSFDAKIVQKEIAVTFDGTFDGFLCVVYSVYYDKIIPLSVQVDGREQLSIGLEVRFIDTDVEKAARVYTGIRKKISEDAAHYVYSAFLAEDEARFLAILKYIQLGFKVGHMVNSHLQEDFVRQVHKLAKYVQREAHLLLGFCRFAETSQKVYYCHVTPKSDVLPLLAIHFCERLMNQQWVIHDKVRNKAAIYDGNSYVIASVPAGDANITYAEGEKETQELWVTFFKTLAIDARKNYKLQRQLLPLYFRKNMTEFQ
ncbi:MAG: TIGR03915 family putative DNA repair protein [Defluviitaleaceae bacterium]|nr:TIGR03915 family putative DNA repair protein [Defluviitaleaceae bacterium]